MTDSTPSVSAPVSYTVNGQLHSTALALSLTDLVQSMQLEGRRYAIECNGVLIPKSKHGQTQIQAHDIIEIVMAVGGG